MRFAISGFLFFIFRSHKPLGFNFLADQRGKKKNPGLGGGRAWVYELGGKFIDTYTYCEARATLPVSSQE
jgi:hypothetical protein